MEKMREREIIDKKRGRDGEEHTDNESFRTRGGKNSKEQTKERRTIRRFFARERPQLGKNEKRMHQIKRMKG